MSTTTRVRRRLPLPDPEQCHQCAGHGHAVKGHIVNTEPRHGYRWRRHECPDCGYRWTSWQMVINPSRLTPRSA